MAKRSKKNPFSLFAGPKQAEITEKIKKLVDSMVAKGTSADDVFEAACDAATPLGKLLDSYSGYGASDTVAREEIWEYAGGKPSPLPPLAKRNGKPRFGIEGVRQHLANKVAADGVRPVARNLGFSPAFISRAANGHEEITDKLARALGFDPCPREYTRSK